MVRKNSVTKKHENIKEHYKLVTRRPIAVIMTALAIIVFGYVSYSKLTLNLMPDISYPTLTVRTEFEGGAPEEVESLISRPIEQALAVVRNKTAISSISRAGQSDVILEFTWDTDMNSATQDTRELLEQFIPPEGAEKPLVLRYDPTLDPIIRLGIYKEQDSSETTLYALRELAQEELKRDLEAIPGVAAVKVKGGLEEEIVVDLDEKELTSLGLSINDVNTRLASENVNLAGGNLEEGETEYIVRTLNLFITLDEISDLIITRRDGVEIRLKDIGSVYKSHKEREVITRVNGMESVEIELYKEADANIVHLAKRVKTRIFGTPRQQAEFERYKAAMMKRAEEASIQEKKSEGEKQSDTKTERKSKKGRKTLRKPEYIVASLPQGVSLALLSDQSTFIENSINEVKNTALLGGLFAIAVLFFFLRSGYSTFIIALSIPLSIIATFAPMNIFNVTLNMMSLGGLALGIGMLVDNSIVVLESIFRCREEGDSILDSAVRGASEVGGAVTASTLTTISVFLPIVFVEGVAGQLFGDLSLTVVFSLLMSLIAALFFIPMLASRDFKAFGKSGKLQSPFLALRAERKLENIYMKHKWAVSEESSANTAKGFTTPSFAATLGKTSVSSVGILGMFAEAFMKFAMLFVAFIEVIAKYFILAILSFVFVPVTLFTSRKGKQSNIEKKIIGFAGKEKPSRFVERITFGSAGKVWNDILSFKVFENFSDSVKAFWETTRKFYSSKPLKTWLRLIIAPLLLGAAVILLKILVKVEFLPKNLLLLLTSICTFLAIAIGVALLTTLLLRPLALVLFFPMTFAFNLFSQIFLKFWLIIILGATLIGKTLISIMTYFLRGVLAPFLYLFDKSFTAITRAYPRLLATSLENKMPIISGSVVLLLVVLFLLVPQLGMELIPKVHQGEFNIELRMPVGTPLEKTDRQIAPMDEFISSLHEIRMRATVIGAENTSAKSSDEGEHTAKITVRLNESGNLIEQEETLIEMIRDKAREIPQVETNISRPTLFSFKTPIEVEVKGYNLQKLKEISNLVAVKMQNIEGIYDVRNSFQQGNPEIQIIYDRELLGKYNLDIYQVAQIIRNKVLGYVPTRFSKEDRKIEIRVKVKKSDRNTLEELKQLNIAPNSPVPIPLAAVAQLRLEEGPAEIRRIEQQRSAVITANVSGLDLGSAAGHILEELESLNLPSDFSLDISGQNKEMKVSMNSLMMAMLLAIFLVYTVMAMLFESIVQPLIIILTIPLALVGAILVLWIGGIPFSVVVGIGIIVLVGIVVNNAIVLVDYTNRLRRRGMELREAVVEAGRVRLRPILMTTATTVLALLPMAMGLGEGAEIRTPMAWTIISGLLISTILTLIIIPTVYTAVEEFLVKVKKS